jgi:hypothetical protein
MIETEGQDRGLDNLVSLIVNNDNRWKGLSNNGNQCAEDWEPAAGVQEMKEQILRKLNC